MCLFQIHRLGKLGTATARQDYLDTTGLSAAGITLAAFNGKVIGPLNTVLLYILFKPAFAGLYQAFHRAMRDRMYTTTCF